MSARYFSQRFSKYRSRLLGSLLLLCAIVAPALWFSEAGDRPTLYVFLSTDVKSTVLEKTLQTKLPNLNVTVFGRFRDFQDAVAAKRPDAMLTLQPLLAAQKLQPTLRGSSNGQDFEKYVLLSAGAPLVGSLSNRMIGVVDILGRKDTQTFVAGLLKTPDVKTKLVTKLEDLLSLLQFSASDAVLVPGSAAKTFAERSKMSLHVREIPDAKVGLAAVAVLTPATAAIVIGQIQILDPLTNRMMGVDKWSKP